MSGKAVRIWPEAPAPAGQGRRGDYPATLENYHFLEKISHFDRERIPERVVHARGFVAHGEFKAYGTIGGEPASTYTRAKLFQTEGRRSPGLDPVLHRDRRAGLVRGGPRPARLRGHVPLIGRASSGASVPGDARWPAPPYAVTA